MRNFPAFFSLFTLLFFLSPLLCLSAGNISENPQDRPTLSYKLPDTVLQNGKEVSAADLVVRRMAAMDLRGYRPEALKAAAVAAQTELMILYREDGSADRYESLSPEQAKDRWGDVWFKTYWPELESATRETWGQLLTKNNRLFYPATFPLSWGQTASGVECPYDFTAEGFETEISVSADRAQKVFPDWQRSLTVKKAQNGRVETVTSGSTVLSGEETARRFGLPSPSFSVRVESGRLIFTCKGKGNGEGMSLYGANEWAKRGKNYREILALFYPETTLS